MKSDLHEMFGVCKKWSPEFINNVCVCGTKRDTPQYLSQMKSDLHEIYSECKRWSWE